MDTRFTDVKKDEPILDKAFYGKKNFMMSLPFLENAIKREHKYIPHEETELYYENQAVKQVFKPKEKNIIYQHITALYPFERVYIDTMYYTLEKSCNAFVCIIDLFSKYAFTQYFVIPKTSSAIKSSQAIKVFKTFMNTIKQPIGYVFADLGSEFKGDFSTFLREQKIPQIISSANDKQKMSPVERFNKTLRLYLEKYRDVYGRLSNKIIKEILNAYNNAPHADLPFSPNIIIHDKDIQLEVAKFYLDERQQNELNIIPDGTPVRILLNVTKFQKTKPVWSDDVYTIEKMVKNFYLLNEIEGHYKYEQLQVINGNTILNPDIKREKM